MATTIPTRPTSTKENVGWAAFFAAIVLSLWAYGPQLVSQPFVQDMALTTKSLVVNMEESPTVQVELRTERVDGNVAHITQATTMQSTQDRPVKTRVYYHVKK